jgi:hypothetical protein
MAALLKTFAVSLTFLVASPAVATDIVLTSVFPNKVKVQIKKTSSNPAAHKIQYSAIASPRWLR